MAGFECITPIDGTRWEKIKINNSAAIRKGSFAKFAGGDLDPSVATERVFFFVDSIIDKNGIPLEVSEVGYTGTYVKGAYGVGRYTAASDNETVDMVSGLGFYVKEGDMFESVPDATIGTTTGSNLNGYYCDLADAYTADESDASTSAAQLLIHGVSPKDSTKGVYSVAERGASVG